jgi:hypothetical protein
MAVGFDPISIRIDVRAESVKAAVGLVPTAVRFRVAVSLAWRPRRQLAGRFHKLRLGLNLKFFDEPLALRTNLPFGAADLRRDFSIRLPLTQTPQKPFLARAQDYHTICWINAHRNSLDRSQREKRAIANIRQVRVPMQMTVTSNRKSFSSSFEKPDLNPVRARWYRVREAAREKWNLD